MALKFAIIIYSSQNIFLGIALFKNSQVTKGKTAKTYEALFTASTDQSKSDFYPYETSTWKFIYHR